jgi:hypothetical protein
LILSKAAQLVRRFLLRTPLASRRFRWRRTDRTLRDADVIGSLKHFYIGVDNAERSSALRFPMLSEYRRKRFCGALANIGEVLVATATATG